MNKNEINERESEQVDRERDRYSMTKKKLCVGRYMQYLYKER